MKRIAISICIGAAMSAAAQEKKDTIALLPVEVKAVRASATAPFAKTNLGKVDIEKQNLGQDLPFLLNQTPSVVVNSDAGNGVGYTGIRIRGTDATRINVTLNGIPYNDAESNGTFFVDLPDFSSSVNSIQVQRGVGTSTNGAGAFGATINLSTNETNKTAYAELNNSYGSFNTWKNTVKVGTGLLGGHFTTDFRASRISSDGFIDRASSDLKSIYFSQAYLSKNTDIRLNIFSGKEKTYQAWYGITEADLVNNRTVNYAGTEKPGDPYNNETDNYQQDHYQLFFTQRFGQKLSANVAGFLSNGKGYYEQYKAGAAYASYGMINPVYGTDTVFTTDLVRQLWLDNKYYGAIYSLLYQTPKTQFTFGGGLTRYDGNHYGEVVWAAKGLTGPTKWYDLDARKNDLNFYAKWQQDISPSIQSFVDLQYRGVQYNINGFRDNPDLVIRSTYNFFNPKFGLSYHKGNWRSFASFSVANKEPNRDDFEAGKQQQPLAETLYDWEAGIEHKSNRFSYGVTAFYMNYKNQLVLTGMINDVGAYTRTNIAKSYRSGIELEGSANIATWIKAAANLSLSRNKVNDFSEYIDDYDNGGQVTNKYSKPDIAFSPSVTGAGTVTILPLQQLSIDLISKYVSKQYLDNTANSNRMLKAYYTQDARAMFHFSKYWLKDVAIIAQVNNLFDKKYEPNGYTYSYFYNNKLATENYYFPMAGINYMIGLNIKL